MATLGKPLAAFSHCEKTHRFQEPFPLCTPPPSEVVVYLPGAEEFGRGSGERGTGSVCGACPLSSTPSKALVR